LFILLLRLLTDADKHDTVPSLPFHQHPHSALWVVIVACMVLAGVALAAIGWLILTIEE